MHTTRYVPPSTSPPCVHQTFIARRIYIHIRNNRLRVRPPFRPPTYLLLWRERAFLPPSNLFYTGCLLARENSAGLFLAFYAAGERGGSSLERERWGQVSISTVIPSSSFPFLSSFRVENQRLSTRLTFYPCLQGAVATDPFFCKFCTLDFEPTLIYVLRKTFVPQLCHRPADVSPNRGYNFLLNQKLQTFFTYFCHKAMRKVLYPLCVH